MPTTIAEIPSEILEVIFHGAWETTITEDEGFQDPTLFLNAVTSTSRLWRQIALQMTILWATVHASWSAEQQALYIDRSGQSRLIHVFVLFPPANGGPDDQFRRLDTMPIFTQTDRWHSVHIRDCGAGVTEDNFIAPYLTGPYNYPNLRFLYLEQNAAEGCSASIALSSGFSIRIPLVDTIHLVGVNLYPLQELCSPLLNLELRGGGFDFINDLLPILETCTALQSLTIAGEDLAVEAVNRSREVVVESRLELPNLYTLIIGDEKNGSDLMALLLGHIEMPNLRCLYIKEGYPNPSDTRVFDPRHYYSQVPRLVRPGLSLFTPPLSLSSLHPVRYASVRI